MPCPRILLGYSFIIKGKMKEGPVTNYHKHSGFVKIIIYSPVIVEARSRKSVSLG